MVFRMTVVFCLLAAAETCDAVSGLHTDPPSDTDIYYSCALIVATFGWAFVMVVAWASLLGIRPSELPGVLFPRWAGHP